MLATAAAFFAATFGGGMVPRFFALSHRRLHTLLALSTGFFLGAVFLHILPELAHDDRALAGAGKRVSLWWFALAGVLAVQFLEVIAFGRHSHGSCDDDHDHAVHAQQDSRKRHRAVGYAALLGISVHSLTDGIAYSVLAQRPELVAALFVSQLGHKLLEGFSLASVFELAEFARAKVVLCMAAFSLLTPLGMLAGEQLTLSLGAYGSAVVTALASGTFLFVSLCSLLPEVFHHREDSIAKIVLLAAGILASLALHEAGA